MARKSSSFDVPLGMHFLSGFVQRTRPLWIALGNLETAGLRSELEDAKIERPVYVTGLARAGTTILLEFLAGHAGVATHKYRDFPGLFVPVWWEKGQRPESAQAVAPQERAHADGMAVTPDSPEAIEECLWMAFFRDAQNPRKSSVLDRSCHAPKFEQFYSDHIRKLLHVRKATRYVAKGNYNLTRLQYLLKLFPDARFLVAVRHPRNHIASLVKQHRLFCKGEAESPRALAYMQRVGHFEFGLDLRLINVGNAQVIGEVEELWRRGEEIRGWARYWASLYGWFFDLLESDPSLQQAAQIVRYEDLCAEPDRVLDEIQAHCHLEDTDHRSKFAARIAAPGYYEPEFSPADERAIEEETGRVAELWEYERTRAISC